MMALHFCQKKHTSKRRGIQEGRGLKGHKKTRPEEGGFFMP